MSEGFILSIFELSENVVFKYTEIMPGVRDIGGWEYNGDGVNNGDVRDSPGSGSGRRSVRVA